MSSFIEIDYDDLDDADQRPAQSQLSIGMKIYKCDQKDHSVCVFKNAYCTRMTEYS